MKVKIKTPLALQTDYRGEWAYTLTADMRYQVEGIVLPNCEAWHGKRLLLSIYNGEIIIYKGYAFDGMTMYPDNAANLTGACLHDALYQTGVATRKQADDLLRAVMKAQGQPDRFLVHLGVRLFGWFAYRSNKSITINKI